MSKLIRIRTCYDCPHFPGTFGLNEEVQQPACEIEHKHIENPRKIPKWCPLEDE